jgi:hypothetical protein
MQIHRVSMYIPVPHAQMPTCQLAPQSAAIARRPKPPFLPPQLDFHPIQFMRLMSLIVGTEFASIEAAKEAVLRYAIDSRESFVTTKDQKNAWVIGCKREDCTFRIRVNRPTKGLPRLTISNPHTCPASTHHNWKRANSIQWLAQNERNRALIAADPTAKPKLLIENQRFDNGQKVSYRQAHRTKARLQREIFGDEAASFQLLPGFISAITIGERGGVTIWNSDGVAEQPRKDGVRPRAYSQLEIWPNTGKFRRCWILPRATKMLANQCRPLAAVDGTACRNRYKQTLLALTMVDGNNETIPISWALVDQENIDNWVWFLRGIAMHISSLNNIKSVFISDRDKGILVGVSTCFSKAVHLHCCQHLAENVHIRYGKACKSMFWAAARANSPESFQLVTDKLREENQACAAYLATIPTNLWAFHALSHPRYGHETSNIQESVNSHWKTPRILPAAQCMVWIWNQIMHLIYKRQCKRQKGGRLTDYASRILEEGRARVREYQVIRGGEEAIVQHLRGHQQIVNLLIKECTCLAF